MSYYDAPAWNRRLIEARRAVTPGPGRRLLPETSPAAARLDAGVDPAPLTTLDPAPRAAAPWRIPPFPASPGGRQD